MAALNVTVTAKDSSGASSTATATAVVTDPVVTTGWPNETTSGPRVTSFTKVTSSSKGTGWSVSSGGELVVNGAGTVLQGLDIPYTVAIKAANVTIQDCIITTSGDGWAIGLYVGGAKIYHNIIQGPQSPAGNTGYQSQVNGLEYGIFDATGNYGGTPDAQFNHIRYINHPFNVTSGTIKENYVHTFSNKGGQNHTDAIFSGGGDTKALVIDHNVLLNDRTDATANCILLSTAFGGQQNVTINNNLLAGGAYVVNAGNTSAHPARNIIITNNQVTTTIYPKGGQYGVWYPAMVVDGVNGCKVSNNVWYDGPNKGKIVS